MRRPCNQTLKITIPIIVIILLKYIMVEEPELAYQTLTGTLKMALWGIIVLALSVAIGLYSRSLIVGLLTLTYLAPNTGDLLLKYQWYAMLGFTILVLGVYAYLRGPHDSTLEVLGFPNKPKITPILATTTLGYLYWLLGLSLTQDPSYWAYILLGALLISKISESPTSAIAGSIIASTGNIGALALSIYASFAPLPALKCSGASIGRLLGYEADTSTTRTLAGRIKRWKTTAFACANGEAIVRVSDTPFVWLYSIDPLKLARKLSSKLGPDGSRRIIIDLDTPGETELSQIMELLKNNRKSIEVQLGSLEDPVKEGVLAALPETLRERDVVVISSCRHEPKGLVKYLETIAEKAIVIAGFCKTSESHLAPIKKPGNTVVIIGDLGDPLEASTILGKMFGEAWRGLYTLIHYNHRYILAYEYCNGGWALVELSI